MQNSQRGIGNYWRSVAGRRKNNVESAQPFSSALLCLVVCQYLLRSIL